MLSRVTRVVLLSIAAMSVPLVIGCGGGGEQASVAPAGSKPVSYIGRYVGSGQHGR